MLFGLGLSFGGLSFPGRGFPVCLGSRRATFDGWRKAFENERQKLANSEFWLNVILATFIALCARVGLTTFMLSYGSALGVIRL